MNSLKLMTIAVSLLIAGSVLAQNTPVADQRQQNQKERIHEGVKYGELTKKEAARLHAEQRTIKAEKQMAKADGKVTAAESVQLHHDQNKASADIYKQKHDAQKKW